MSKQLLQEYYELCPDGMCPDLLTEREKKEISNGAMYLTGRIQTADKQNGNGRVYPYEVLQREVDNYKKIVQDHRACGELDHPDDSVVNLKNVSHLIVDVWWEGKDVMGKMKILDTPSGKTLKELINAGVKIDRKDSNNLTPLIWASAYGHEDIVKYLISLNANINHADNTGKTAADYALAAGHLGTYEYLIKK